MAPRHLGPLLALVLVVTGAAGTAGVGTATAQAPEPRPDALIRTNSQSAYGGDGVYNRTGGGQSRTTVLRNSRRARFWVRVQNDSDGVDSIRVIGTRAAKGFTVRYFVGNRNVSAQVKAGRFILQDLAPGGSQALRVDIQATNRARPGSQHRVVISARSVANGQRRDNVAAIAKLPAFTNEQRRVAELINQTRRSNGRGNLALHRQLTDKAQAWAQRMASQGRLSHSRLSDGVPPGWRSLAENVGVGGSIVQVHNAFLRSGGHRANMLGNYTHVGTGVAHARGRIWICQVFMRR